ncbi:MAG: hypothetical protein WAN11_26040 [Syntrophobacteraceae bacterium]
MARYAASQTKQWEWNTHNAVLSDLIAEAEAYYNDPRRVAAVVSQLDNETGDYGLKHGWSPEVHEYQLRKNNDMLWSAVIKRQALFDPAGAMATYQDAAAKKRISGSAQGELEQFLKPIQDLQSAQNAYEQVTGGAMAQAIAGEAQRQGVDPSTALTIWSAEGGHSLCCVSPLCAGPSQNASSPRPISCEGGITNPATKNPSSSATGIFQHTSATWSDLGGTGQDRLDASRQVQLGVALTRQNTAALAKDLGRQPQPWEVYLAHQQGMDGATALLHADPNANAGDVVGNPEAITGNGGTTEMTAGQFINTIKGYVDRHSMMYAANGAPTAQNLTENYEAGLQAVTDLALQEHPGDPAAEERYRSHFIQQAGQAIHAERVTQQANWNIVRASLNGPNAIKSEQDFFANPRLMDAYNAILKTDPSAYRVVNNAVNTNAMAMWDPPATAQTNQLYDTLSGMKDTDRAQFSNLNLMSYYGGMPVAQLNSLMGAQNRIRNNDPTEAAKHANLISSISAVNDLTTLAAASAESPFYKMDQTSPSPPEQQKWNEFVSKYGQALDDWQQNNNDKIPTDMQKREIAQGILFPNGTAGRLGMAATEGNPNFSDKNTRTNTNAETNVLESYGKPDLADSVSQRTEDAQRDVDGLHVAGWDAPQQENPSEIGTGAMPDLWNFSEVPTVGQHSKLRVTHELPSDAVPQLAPDGRTFFVPPDADFHEVYEAIKANGLDPIAASKAIGHFGTFDFQRQEDKNLLISEYTNASNFAVGVYMRGAGFSLQWTKFIAGLFALTMSSNAGDPNQSVWWTNGWYAADLGMYSKKSQ